MTKRRGALSGKGWLVAESAVTPRATEGVCGSLLPENLFLPTANGYPEAEFAEYGAFGKKHASAIKGGNALQPTPTAKTVRVRDAKVLTFDGPFAETKEQLGGYYLIEAPTIEEAASIASGIPAARYGSIEVRPILVFS
jgi:hypothetical protein